MACLLVLHKILIEFFRIHIFFCFSFKYVVVLLNTTSYCILFKANSVPLFHILFLRIYKCNVHILFLFFHSYSSTFTEIRITVLFVVDIMFTVENFCKKLWTRFCNATQQNIRFYFCFDKFSTEKKRKKTWNGYLFAFDCRYGLDTEKKNSGLFRKGLKIYCYRFNC